MKIVRHIAPDMRQALRSIRGQLGEDAVILSSRRVSEGVEVTAAVDFDAASLQDAMSAPAESLTPAPLPPPPATAAAPRALPPPSRQSTTFVSVPQTMRSSSAVAANAANSTGPAYATAPVPAPAAAPAHAHAHAARPTIPTAHAAPPAHVTAPGYSHAAASHYFAAAQQTNARPFAHILTSDAIPADIPALRPASELAPAVQVTQTIAPAQQPHAANAASARRESTLTAHSLAPAGDSLADRSVASARDYLADRSTADRSVAINIAAPAAQDFAAEALADLPPPAAPGAMGDAMGSELKTLRRMLETQLAQLAWNDLTRRAPVHIEILRELTEIGITQDLSDYILKQLPEKVELGFARRFAIAGLSQYLLVTGDRWLENGGRVAFIGSTGVGKTTTLAKLAVRWVLRHGTRDLALVGCDTVRIGAQDQIQSLGQLLGVPVYTPENFESLPTLLSRLGDRHRLILIDTPGSSLRDAQLSTRLGVLSNCASQMETALVLAASTQAGAIEETVKRYAPANPACCVLTKLDEAASLGGALSALIRARLPVSYSSEGQRVPEDLRPARALELVSTAVRLAKASGAAADEDLLRRRFGKTANAIT
jgi:flagellar biosynthesis protein FlhF